MDGAHGLDQRCSVKIRAGFGRTDEEVGASRGVDHGVQVYGFGVSSAPWIRYNSDLRGLSPLAIDVDGGMRARRGFCVLKVAQ
jgi:hypothetical protein